MIKNICKVSIAAILCLIVIAFFCSSEAPVDYVTINYEKVELQKMIDDLETNALAAKDTYQNKYIEIYGEISTIDASGDYISLIPKGGFALDSILCSIRDKELLNFVRIHNSGECITVQGQITDVGEVFGFTMLAHNFIGE